MIVRQGVVDTHPEMIAAALQRFRGKLAVLLGRMWNDGTHFDALTDQAIPAAT